jgi:periplasmic divalent cation tolerance protein
MRTDYCLVFCTCPDRESALRLADVLVAGGLAACVNLIPGLTSVYRWEGRVERAEEHLLLIKTESAGYQALEAAIKAHHPYELPEIIAVPVERGSSAYLQWITACLHSHA